MREPHEVAKEILTDIGNGYKNLSDMTDIVKDRDAENREAIASELENIVAGPVSSTGLEIIVRLIRSDIPPNVVTVKELASAAQEYIDAHEGMHTSGGQDILWKKRTSKALKDLLGRVKEQK